MRKALWLVVVLAVLAGCGSKNQSVVGLWKGQLKPVVQPGTPGYEQVKSLVGDSTLEIRKDQTFTMQLGITPIEGRWQIYDHELMLMSEKMDGMTFDQLKKEIQNKGGDVRILEFWQEMMCQVGTEFDAIDTMHPFGRIKFTK